MAQLRAKGLAAVDGDLVARPQPSSRSSPHDPAAFDHEPLKPYNVGPDALLVNFKSRAASRFAPDAAGDGRGRARRPAARRRDARRGAGARAAKRAATGGCARRRRSTIAGDRGAIVVRRHAIRRRAASATGGSRCSTTRITSARCSTTYFRAAGGRFAGGVKERARTARAAPFAVLESPPLYDIVRDVNKLSNNVMARQIFLTLATTRVRAPATTAQRHRRRQALACRTQALRCRGSCSRTGPGCRGRSAIPRTD